MLHYIYSRSFISVITFMALALTAWGALPARVGARRWRWGNLALMLLMTAAILYATLFSRAEGSAGLILAPFASLTAARQQPEIYREMLMNIFLFFPLGLTLSNALPRKWHRWLRIALTTFVGCILSVGIEYTQYRYALGMAEVDDVICNTLGAFIGSTSLLITPVIEKYRERVWHTNMTLTATERQFLHIAKAAISGGDLPAESVDWPAVFALAGQQKLLPIVFEAVRKSPAAEENAALFAAVKQQVIAQVLHQTMRASEFAALYQKLRAAGLHPVVVKGQLCSRLYPLRDHRIQRGRRHPDSGRRIFRLPRAATRKRSDYRYACGRAGYDGRGVLHKKGQPALHRTAPAFIRFLRGCPRRAESLLYQSQTR